MIHVIDTHTLIWYLDNSPRLGPTATQILANPIAEVVIPTMCLAEIAFLHARGRIRTNLAAVFSRLHILANWRTYSLDDVVAMNIPSQLNIHDGIIVATANVHRDVLGQPTALITRDAQIQASGLIQVIW